MRKLKTLIAVALLATSLSSAGHAAVTQEEEQFAVEAASLLMLGTLTCHFSGPEQDAAMKMVEKAYDASGHKTSDYPGDEWMRKIFFFISGNRLYSGVLDRNPASVAVFCKTLREKALPSFIR
jgi:hypothetical protein